MLVRVKVMLAFLTCEFDSSSHLKTLRHSEYFHEKFSSGTS